MDNILLSNDKKIKIIDFGFSLYIPNDIPLTSFCGTPSYMAPELVLKKEYYGK